MTHSHENLHKLPTKVQYLLEKSKNITIWLICSITMSHPCTCSVHLSAIIGSPIYVLYFHPLITTVYLNIMGCTFKGRKISIALYNTRESKQLTVESHSAGIVSTLHQTTTTAILILLNWISTYKCSLL